LIFIILGTIPPHWS